MKEIRLKYHRDTGIRINPEINLIQYHDHFPKLYDYIVWLEDQSVIVSREWMKTEETIDAIKLVTSQELTNRLFKM